MSEGTGGMDRPPSHTQPQATEAKRIQKGLKPITADNVAARIRWQAADIGRDQQLYASSSRGVEEYLDQKTYALLPGLGDKSARQLIQELPEGATLLDVACGNGKFAAEVKSVNPRIDAYGYDGLTRDMKLDPDHFIQGSLDQLAPETYRGMRFDLVTNVATSYHAEDFFGGGLIAMTSMLNDKGTLLISSIPRTVEMGIQNDPHNYVHNHPPERIIENDAGEIIHSGLKEWDDVALYNRSWGEPVRTLKLWARGRTAGVFRPDGSVVSPAEYVAFLQRKNQGNFTFEHSIVETSDPRENSTIAKIAVQRLADDAQLNMDNVFYARLEIDEISSSFRRDRLGYIIAETTQQANDLRQQGFVSVGSTHGEAQLHKRIAMEIAGQTPEQIADSRYDPAVIKRLQDEGLIHINAIAEEGQEPVQKYVLPR